MIFISYSSSDRKVAESIADTLTASAISYWIDFREIPIGQRFISEIATSLEKCTSYVIINPSTSLGSYWVSREYQAALRLRGTGKSPSLFSVETTNAKINETSETFDNIFRSTSDLVNFFASRKQPTIANSREPLRSKAILVDFRGATANFSDTEIWLGYTDKLQAIDDWLLDNSPGILITGKSGSGKTAFIRNWLYAFQRLGYSFMVSAAIEFIDAKTSPAVKIPFPPARSAVERPYFVVIDTAERMKEEEISTVMEKAVDSRTRMIIVGQAIPETLLSLPHINLSKLSEREVFLLASSAGLKKEQANAIHAITQGSPVMISQVIQVLKDNQRVTEESSLARPQG